MIAEKVTWIECTRLNSATKRVYWKYQLGKISKKALDSWTQEEAYEQFHDTERGGRLITKTGKPPIEEVNKALSSCKAQQKELRRVQKALMGNLANRLK